MAMMPAATVERYLGSSPLVQKCESKEFTGARTPARASARSGVRRARGRVSRVV